MNHISELSIAFVSIVIVLLIVEVIYFAHLDQQQIKKELSYQAHGYKRESLINTIQAEEIKNQELYLTKMAKSACSGAVRGAMFGFLYGNIPGALAGSISFAMINPLILGFEHAV